MRKKGGCPGESTGRIARARNAFMLSLQTEFLLFASCCGAEWSLHVMAYARARQMWNFLDRHAAQAVLCCTLDGTDEVSGLLPELSDSRSCCTRIACEQARRTSLYFCALRCRFESSALRFY